MAQLESSGPVGKMLPTRGVGGRDGGGGREIGGKMPPARGVGKWICGWEGRREGGRVLAVENFNLILHAMIIYYVYYIY